MEMVKEAGSKEIIKIKIIISFLLLFCCRRSGHCCVHFSEGKRTIIDMTEPIRTKKTPCLSVATKCLLPSFQNKTKIGLDQIELNRLTWKMN